MNSNTVLSTRIQRIAAGSVVAAALTLIALGTATAGNAETNPTSPSYAPTPVQKGHGGYEPPSLTPYGTYQNDDKHPGHH